jgi:hypothetical protein
MSNISIQNEIGMVIGAGDKVDEWVPCTAPVGQAAEAGMLKRARDRPQNQYGLDLDLESSGRSQGVVRSSIANISCLNGYVWELRKIVNQSRLDGRLG